jgi:hypothetical protein
VKQQQCKPGIQHVVFAFEQELTTAGRGRELNDAALIRKIWGITRTYSVTTDRFGSEGLKESRTNIGMFITVFVPIEEIC